MTLRNARCNDEDVPYIFRALICTKFIKNQRDALNYTAVFLL